MGDEPFDHADIAIMQDVDDKQFKRLYPQ